MSPEQDRDWLIYKWRPEGQEAGSTKREIAIRLGSPLMVRQGEVAAFMYPGQQQKLGGQTGAGQTIGGAPLDFVEGYWQGELQTANLPILAGIQSLFMDGGTRFPAQVYFINIAGANTVKFGVPYFDMVDPALPHDPVGVAVRGTVVFAVKDYRSFLQKHSMVDFDMGKFEIKIRDAVISYVRDAMMDIQNKLAVPLVQIDRYRREIRGILQQDLGSSLTNTFAVSLEEINIAAVELDKDSEAYAKLARITQKVSSGRLEAQADLSLRGMEDQYELNKNNLTASSAIGLEHMAESARIGREEGQYAQHMQTDLGGFALHQLKQQEEIAKAAAGAMGQMGQGAGVSMGQGGGFNPGAMMAGMAMGGAVGQGMAGMMGNVFNQMGQQMPGQTPPPMPGMAAPGAPPPIPGAGVPPPPPPGLQFSVAVDGQTYGPYDLNALSQMASAGQFNAQSQVWRQGMAGWQAAGTVPELALLFTGTGAPPPPPPAP
jgi:membrane protease subunit (stomatin/prohibitin family)